MGLVILVAQGDYQRGKMVLLYYIDLMAHLRNPPSLLIILGSLTKKLTIFCSISNQVLLYSMIRFHDGHSGSP